MTEAVYLIIPVHNRKAITLNCLQTLKTNGDLQKYHVVVVDDGSTDGTTQAIKTQYPNIKILQGDGKLWWTGAIKMGMEYAYQQGAEYMIWLNDDCQFSPNTIENLVDFAHTNPNTIIGGQSVNPENKTNLVFGGKQKTWQGYRFLPAPENQIISCDLLSGNIVCLPRSIIDKIGYPDTKITPHYGGDSLYLIRAKKAGYSIFVDGRNSVYTIPSESPLYPQKWLLGEGDPLNLIKLTFIPQSGLSWRVWLTLNWEAYNIWGIIMFLKKYISLLLITALRFIPLKFRQQLFNHYFS